MLTLCKTSRDQEILSLNWIKFIAWQNWYQYVKIACKRKKLKNQSNAYVIKTYIQASWLNTCE